MIPDDAWPDLYALGLLVFVLGVIVGFPTFKDEEIEK